MSIRTTLTLLVGLGVLGTPMLAGGAAPTEHDNPSVRLAGRVLLPDGTLASDMVVVVQDGKIIQIGKPTEFEGQVVRRAPAGSVICPGMIDLLATPSAVGQTVEDVHLLEPESNPLRVLDPRHRDFRTALEVGITSVMVGPAASNLVNGVCVTIRSHVADRFDVIRGDGPMLFAFGEGVWRRDRRPTSRAGAVLALRELVAQARNGKAHPQVNDAVAGKRDAWIVCSDKQDIVAVSQALGDARKWFGVFHSKDALDVAESVHGMRQPVVLGPYSLATGRRELLGAAELTNAGIDVAFRAGFPVANARALRLSASLAVRHGMDPAAARRAITIAPAKVAGVEERIGSIAKGKDADLVIFSGDPLRMDASVLEVYVLGQRVYWAKHQKNRSPAGAQP